MKKRILFYVIFVILLAFFFSLFSIKDDSTVLLYALYSFSRMLAAYILSFAFSVVYGFYAARSKRNERIMIPILDILQSVPILGFFPVVMFALIAFLPTAVGVELASIFLIFTSQAWNMAFGVYESIITIPQPILDSAKSFNLRRGQLFRTLYFPAMIPKLVYNSIMSWAGGWYFLFAAEIISLGNVSYTLPGLGSFMWEEVSSNHIYLGLLALGTLIIIIISMDIFIWRPLTISSTKYKYEEVEDAQTYQKFYFLKFLSYLPRVKIITDYVKNAFNKILRYRIRKIGLKFRYLKWAWIFFFLFIIAAIIFGFVSKFSLFLADLAKIKIDQMTVIPLAIVLSSMRMAVAYAISLAWILPVSYYMISHKKANQVLTPIFEVLASIPATALFPFIVVIFLKLPGGLNLISIFLIMTGMQWYILFNVLGGMNNFPADLTEVSKSFKFKRWLYLKKVFLPGIYPSIITGSITGWGGGWNALIISEYIAINGVVYSVIGLGSLIDIATYHNTNLMLNLIYLFFMIITVLSFNRLLWKRLYKRVEKYKIE
ncbi:MAG: ABC transporter permease subunit [Thermoplasmata archaeon]